MKYIAIVDDHVLMRQGLAGLINSFIEYKVIIEANNGKHFIDSLKPPALPDIVLLDVTMPEMDGFETAKWLKKNYPEVKILALSMLDDERTIIRMLQSGAHGYILKNCTPKELLTALDTIAEKGYFINDHVGVNLIVAMNKGVKSPEEPKKLDLSVFNEKEIEFLKYNCSEKSYKEIGQILELSPRTIEWYKEGIEKKTGIKNRIGLAVFAIKNGIVKL
jgi:two-component system invasion response regulator UvrY